MSEEPNMEYEYTIKPTGKFLLDSGLLFTINRTVLHPYGLAMGVDTETDEVTIYDARQDPEGWMYTEDMLKHGKEKYDKFLADFGTAKIKERHENLGFVIQPVYEIEKVLISGGNADESE
jgi:hypothetical protein